MGRDFLHPSREIPRPVQTLTQWVLGLVSRLKRLERDVDHPLPSGAEIKRNGRATPLRLCVASRHVAGWNLLSYFTLKYRTKESLVHIG
jgi:hypothetical protein